MSPPKIGRMISEFVVIVVGVLAALAVDEFRTTQGERAEERLHLQGLAEDLARSADNIDDMAGLYVRTLEQGRLVMPVLQGVAPVPEDTVRFLFALYQPTRTPEPQISDATYSVLVSTGSLRLIRDDVLRRSVVDYYESIEGLLRPTDFNVDRASYRAAVRSLLPLEVQLAIRSCRLEELGACRDTFVGLPLRDAVEAVLSDTELIGELTFSIQSSAIRRFDVALDRTSELGASVRNELER